MRVSLVWLRYEPVKLPVTQHAHEPVHVISQETKEAKDIGQMTKVRPRSSKSRTFSYLLTGFFVFVLKCPLSFAPELAPIGKLTPAASAYICRPLSVYFRRGREEGTTSGNNGKHSLSKMIPLYQGLLIL